MVKNDDSKLFSRHSKLELAIAFCMGSMVGALIQTYLGSPKQVRVFREENKPGVMRIYSPGKDKIMLDVDNGNIYDVSLIKYLGAIENEADRNLERARIEKLVGWYD